ncbi:MAG: hypothetical protein GC182_09650 [Rhodopseudomonas sp.]|nr:hypothetical protein [Rhodopseudomonas sp.]
MTLINRGILAVAGIWALLLTFPAAAQENLDQGKSGAQLFASDCAICHKTPQGLGKTSGLEGFLREHYTASRESAALITKYLEDKGSTGTPTPVKTGDTDKRPAKSTAKEKSAKSGESKKPAKSKDASAKAAKPAGDEAKTESKSEPKPKAKEAEAKSEPKPDAKPEAKSEAEPTAGDKADKPN